MSNLDKVKLTKNNQPHKTKVKLGTDGELTESQKRFYDEFGCLMNHKINCSFEELLEKSKQEVKTARKRTT